MNEQTMAEQLTHQERDCLEHLWRNSDAALTDYDSSTLTRLLAWDLIEPVPRLLLPVLPSRGGYRLTGQGMAVLQRLRND